MRTFLGLICLLFFSCESNQHILTFAAGENGRNQGIIHFDLPEGASWEAGQWEMINQETGAIIPLQQAGNQQAVFILDQPMVANSDRVYQLRPAKEAKLIMEAVKNEAELELIALGKPFLTYNTATDCPPEGLPEYYCRSGYIHPLYSPGGAVVTDGFPVGHTHQHGLFFAWVNTTFRGDFTDFWNQQKETGTAAHLELTSTTSGSVFSGFSSKLQQISLKHGPVLNETWEIIAFDLGKYYVLDLISTQNNITDDTLHINKYHYGGLGIRGNHMWNSVDTLAFKAEAQFLTSEGKARIEANHSRPRWTAMYGETEKGIAGVAVLDHPDNFRFPQPVRVHPTMPYFCLAPMVEEAMPIAPGATYVSKYRIVTFDGIPDAKELDALWVDYFSPLRVQSAM